MQKRKKSAFRLSQRIKPKMTFRKIVIISSLALALISIGLFLFFNTVSVKETFAASTVTSTQSGPWNSAATWGGTTPPDISDRVVINHTITIPADCSADKITINAGGVLQGDGSAHTLTIDGTSGSDINIDGKFDAKGTTIKVNRNNQIDGTGIINFYKFDLNSKTIKVKNTCTSTINFSGASDPFLNPGNFNPGNSATVCYNGTLPQTLSSDNNIKFNNLVISNAAGVTLGKSLTTDNLQGNLSIASGTLYTGGFSITGKAGTTFSISNGATLNTDVTNGWSGFSTISLGTTSTVNYSGSNQTVNIADYGQLAISGSGTKTLDGNSSVNTLTLTAGSLSLNGNILTINNSSALALTRIAGTIISENTSNASKIKWNIGTSTGAYLFPFATNSGTYIPFTFTIASPGTGSGSMSISTYPTAVNNTPYPSGVTHVKAKGIDNSSYTVDRFWQIDASGYTSNPTAALTFTASSAEIGSIASLRAQRWNGTNWDAPLPNQVTAGNSVTVPLVSTFSPWTLAGASNPLPVELIAFNAVLNGNQVDVNWTTATETDNDYFIVERSADGISFEKLEKIKGAGNSSEMLKYSVTDRNPIKGASYYRLKQVDFDGKTHTSKDVIVLSTATTVQEEFELTGAFPNPFSERMTIELRCQKDMKVNMAVYGLNGQLFHHGTLDCIEGTNTFYYMQESHLPAGTYLLNLSGEEGYRKSVRIVKKE